MNESTETEVADDLYQPCIAHQGDDCKLCKPMRVMPVGVNERQLSRLHAQIEKLPKTGDGTPICPGDIVYVANEDREYWGDDEVLAIRVDSISCQESFPDYNGPFVISGGLEDGGGNDWEGGNLDCYRSRDLGGMIPQDSN